MTSRIVAIVGLALVLLLGASAIDAALVGSGTHEGFDEQFTPEGGETIVLENSFIEHVVYDDDDEIEVYDSDGNLVPAEGNYTWDQDDGTIFVEDGNSLSEDNNANITYGYTSTTDEQRGFASTLADGIEIAQMMILVLGVGLVLAAVRVMGGA